jgi:hypothetical protein
VSNQKIIRAIGKDGKPVKGFIGELKTKSFVDKYEWKLAEDDKKIFNKIVKSYYKRIEIKPRVRFNNEVGFHTVKLAGVEYVAVQPITGYILKTSEKESEIRVGKPGQKGFGYTKLADLRKCLLIPRYQNNNYPGFALANFTNKLIAI